MHLLTYRTPKEFASPEQSAAKRPVKVVDAVNLVGSIDREDETVQVLTADHTRETPRVVRLARRSQHLNQHLTLSVNQSFVLGSDMLEHTATPPVRSSGQ